MMWDYYEKYGMYRSVGANGELGTLTAMSRVGLSSLVASTSVGSKLSYNFTDRNTTYLFEVEPIKWRVISGDGSNLTLMADDILDTARFNYSNSYNHEWQYSTLRAWLNGLEENLIYDNTTKCIQYSSGRGFIDMAFNQSVQNAIVPVVNTQDAKKSKYNGAYYYYDEAEAASAGEPVKLRPQTVDKVWIASFSQIQSGNFVSMTTGLPPKIFYNSDYSIATGNTDGALAAGMWTQNIRGGANN